jgi:cyclin-dependent kinase 10
MKKVKTENIQLHRFNDKQSPLQVSPFFTGNCNFVSKYKKLNRVGEGTYGIVYRACDTKIQKYVALKRIRIDSENNGFPVSALREISLLRNLSHPNIVSVLEVVVADGLENIFMVMEYCHQDLAYLMDHVISKNPQNAYTPAQVKCLMNQLFQGVNYLHDNYIIHRDLKLSNLLLTDGGVLKIADFGLARQYTDPPDSMTPKVVTLWYRSPELLLGTCNYDQSIDVWSIGCIFGEFIKSKPLLPGKNDFDQLLLICELLGSPNLLIWPELEDLPLYSCTNFPKNDYDCLKSMFKQSSWDVIDLLQQMLVYRPLARITCRQALDHVYFKQAPLACMPVMLPTYPELRNIKK